MSLTKISTGGVKDDAASQAKIADEAVDEARLQVSNAGSNGQFLSKQSGNTGGLTWATVDSTPEGTAIKSTGESGTNKYLRVDGDGTSSWHDPDETYAAKVGAEFTGAGVGLKGANQLKFYDPADSSNFVHLKAPALTTNTTFLLPTTDGSSGQYLKTDGSGVLSFSTVTVPPAGNTVDLVADGAIAAGKPVIITSAGKAKQVGNTFTLKSAPDDVGNRTTFNNNAITSYQSAAYDAAEKVSIIHYFKGTGSPNGWSCEAAELNSDGTRNTGTTLGPHFACSSVTGSSIVSIGSRKFVAFFNDGNDFNARVITVAADKSCSAGTTVNFDNGGGTIKSQSSAYDPDTGRVVCVYRVANDGSNSHRAYACVFSVSGTTLTAGTPVLVENGHNSNHQTCCYDEHTNRLVIAYQNMSNQDGYVRLATISSSSNTLTVHGASGSFEGTMVGSTLATNNKGQVAVAYNKTSSPERVRATLFTIDASNNTVSFGTAGDFSADSKAYDAGGAAIAFRYEPSGDVWVAAWSNNSDNQRLQVAFRQYTGTTWGTLTSELDLESTQVHYVAMHASDAGLAQLVLFHQRNSNSTPVGSEYRITTSTVASNLNTGHWNFVGFADAAINDGATGTIKLLGNVVGNQSGLSAGSVYYVQNDGTMASGGGANFAGGLALSATTLLIQRKMN